LCTNIHHLSLGESSKLQSPQKALLLREFEDTKRSLAHKEEEMQQLMERMQSLEDTQARQNREWRWDPREIQDIT